MNPSLFWSTFWLNFSKPIVPSEHDVFFSVGPIGGEILKRSNEMPFALTLWTNTVFFARRQRASDITGSELLLTEITTNHRNSALPILLCVSVFWFYVHARKKSCLIVGLWVVNTDPFAALGLKCDNDYCKVNPYNDCKIPYNVGLRGPTPFCARFVIRNIGWKREIKNSCL